MNGSAGPVAPIGGGVPIIAPEPAFRTLPKGDPLFPIRKYRQVSGHEEHH